MEEQGKRLVSLCWDFRILCRFTKNARKKTKQGSALATPFSRRPFDVRRGFSFIKRCAEGISPPSAGCCFRIAHFYVKRIYYFVMLMLLMIIIFLLYLISLYLNWDLPNPLSHLTVTAPPEWEPMECLSLWERCQQS